MSSDFLTHDLAFTPASGSPLEMLGREWLLTNGTGAFAMGTVPGANTRRYHGLLIAAARPPVDRIVALNQVLEQLFIGSEKFELTTCLFRDAAGHRLSAPEGCAMLRRFQRGPSVAWTYAAGPVEITRQLTLHWKQQAATLRYRVRVISKLQTPRARLRLRLFPMLTLRDFHALARQVDFAGLAVSQAADALTVRRGAQAVTLRVPGAVFTAKADCWYGLHYPVETERGQDDTEDHFLPGYFDVELDPAGKEEVILTAALGDHAAPPGDDGPRIAHLRPIAERLTLPGLAEVRASLGEQAAARHPAPMENLLALAADDFVVDRFFKSEKLATIVAGYPWFADWGRDTFIALPGLLLTTGRLDEARSCLRAFAHALREGLVPNVFSDYDDTAAQYNTVDASLWFIHAAMAYVEASADHASWNGWLRDACITIIEAYIKGTGSKGEKEEGAAASLIRMAGDGLITAGSASTQLTWMDAACGGVVFTPRQGKAVEINALWFHVLAGMADMLTRIAPGDKPRAQHYAKLTSRIGRAFAKVFWDDQMGCLCDHVWTDDAGQEHRDRSLRPNQIFAASLPNSPLPRTRQVAVLKAVTEKLLTPMGLRTLPVDDPNYHPRYTGPQMQRDEAYHQGTIWPWLIGPYAEAVLRVGKFSAKAKSEARAAIAPLLGEMLDAPRGGALGQLAEIYEAQEPHRPVGAAAQAWSVAELIRVLALLSK